TMGSGSHSAPLTRERERERERLPPTNASGRGKGEGRERIMRIVIAFLALTLTLGGEAYGCFRCASYRYFGGEGTVGSCDPGSDWAQCDAGANCEVKKKCDEVTDPITGEKQQVNCHDIRFCNGWCKGEGACSTGGGGGGNVSSWWFENLSDGFWGSFCAAEYAAWECGY
ncbi:MAG: hypothetical protein ACP5NF_11380, partial [Thermoanaerobaculum sp.]